MVINAKTDTGLVRSSNQDGFKIGLLADDRAAWAVVCDGMGGANGGSVASGMALESISNDIVNHYRDKMSANSVMNLLKTSIINANTRIHNESVSNADLMGMGTTVVVVLIIADVAYIAHVGDSRAYRITDGISQITKDHSVVQTLVEKGKLSQQQARTHPDKNIITRALGVDRKVDIDYNEIEINSGEIFLICTDGLTNYAEDEEILQIVKESETEKTPDMLIQRANENGGGDNITAAIIRV